MDGLEQEWRNEVRVIRLNALDREARPLLAHFGVRFMPTYVLLDSDGQEVWRSIGSINAHEVRAIVEQLP